MMETEFVKIGQGFYQLKHVISVTKVNPFKGKGNKKIAYLVRLSEEAAGGSDPKLRNRWCTEKDVEPFLRKMRGLPLLDEEVEEQDAPESIDSAV